MKETEWTETEWGECADPSWMVEFLSDKVNGRVLRLFAVASCRRLWDFTTDEHFRKCVELSDNFCEGKSKSRDLQDSMLEPMWRAYYKATEEGRTEFEFHEMTYGLSTWVLLPADMPEHLSLKAAVELVGHHYRKGNVLRSDQWFGSDNWWKGEADAAMQEERCAQVALIREIAGNPFRPVSISPAWLTPTVVSLATAAYNQRDLPSGNLDTDRLGILADALEEAGCDQGEILGHLRSDGTHVRGCWVLDAVLAKDRTKTPKQVEVDPDIPF